MPDDIKIISTKPFRDSFTDGVARDSVKESFLEYKTTNNNIQDGWVFGRDVPYHRPNAVLQAEMQHLHLLTVDSYNEDKQQYNNTSDYHLAYCFNDDQSIYCLLDMLTHEDAESMDIMLNLAKLAERFKTRF
ncbi:type II toxin-antitoxin system YafO family toxin [Photobacterium carnosum]|uniref:type II toxin-antitoxin system YafO family toxin n=1 Tax=Photobacterium carnosum TaxID=2023717 RepID=UPI001E436E6B|nr:type II toxin-antitoxin system YafO family toxin [Photobacterium carnosum]MCD9537175.1 type II toxin-antitoxin system YafO family toxin [Photobacterium carnosum]MCF2161720.1 type II toxin-antitoxin system YafO family toxin [Photobacterium carnosum]